MFGNEFGMKRVGKNNCYYDHETVSNAKNYTSGESFLIRKTAMPRT